MQIFQVFINRLLCGIHYHSYRVSHAIMPSYFSFLKVNRWGQIHTDEKTKKPKVRSGYLYQREY